VLHKNLELRQHRHTVLASNIANAETPGFVAKDVRFEEALRAAAAPPPPPAPLWRTHPEHLPVTMPRTAIRDVQGALVATPSNDVGRDLNTVSIDREMAKLTTNTFHYNASAEITSRVLDQLKRTISESGQ
jgi:flagellar basal-body rod protein FlgB